MIIVVYKLFELKLKNWKTYFSDIHKYLEDGSKKSQFNDGCV